MLSKKLISGLPAVCDWQLTVWEGGRRERPRPVRPLPLPLPLSPAKLSATDDKLSPFVGNRGQGKARACTWAKISSRPQGPAPALMEHGPPTPIFPHTHTNTFCPAQTQHLNQRPEYTQRTPSTPTYPLPKFTVKNPRLTYLSMLLFPVPPITKQAILLGDWRHATSHLKPRTKAPTFKKWPASSPHP